MAGQARYYSVPALQSRDKIINDRNRINKLRKQISFPATLIVAVLCICIQIPATNAQYVTIFANETLQGYVANNTIYELSANVSNSMLLDVLLTLEGNDTTENIYAAVMDQNFSLLKTVSASSSTSIGKYYRHNHNNNAPCRLMSLIS